MNQYWKDSKAIQFAIGITTLLIVATWFLTGDFFLVSDVMFKQPVEDSSGNVQALPAIWPIIQGMLFQGICWIGVSVISLATGLWSALASLVNPPPKDTSAVPATAVPQVFTVQQPPVAWLDNIPSSQAPAIREAVLKLGEAAGEPDSDADVAEWRNRIRKPRAISALAMALDAEDQETANKRFAELSSMLWSDSKPQRKGPAK